MCGIAGTIGDVSPELGCASVQSMVSALAHRGPDDRGQETWISGPHTVTLGNTRLSILDLSAAGHQPMADDSGRYVTVFNGEIYNFQELRTLLDPRGELFRTCSDTEVIFHAYHRWGLNAFRAFRGMFAFALLDRVERVLHLVRDPLGIKPLYYYAGEKTLLFASEVRALLATGQVPRQINPESVEHFLAWGWVGQGETLVRGVHMLQPGHVLTVDLAVSPISWQVARYETDAIPERQEKQADGNESTGHMFHLLAQSVKAHLVSDVPVGLFLSGGIDSTAILHLMREARCGNPKTFSVVFPERDFSEGYYATKVAEQYEADHQELELSESDVVSVVPDGLNAMDQPTMDGLNTYMVSKAVHEAGVKVALSGRGGDELFAGYPSFKRARWAKAVQRIPGRIRRAVASGGAKVRSGLGYDKGWELLGSDCTPLSAYRISRSVFQRAEIDALAPGRAEEWPSPSTWDFDGDEINEVSRLELRGYMTDLLLRDTDFMSMASSLEVRVPFVDKWVVRHAFQMQGPWKIKGKTPKPLLLDSMRGAIPGFVWNRPKMGFVLPFDRWMKSTLHAEIEETLRTVSFARKTGLAPDSIAGVWRSYQGGQVRWTKPWTLFVLLRWCRQHGMSL
jgi:asparagine synthase (glutamine-hydrolysing)